MFVIFVMVELLSWFLLHVEAIKGTDCCNDLAAPLIVCMQDKTAAVRTIAEQLLTVLMSKAAISKSSKNLPQIEPKCLFLI